MAKQKQQNYIRIRREEYVKLKHIEKQTSLFLQYLGHIRDIKEAREDVRKGRMIPQDQLFESMGI